MAKYVVVGGERLDGTVRVAGAKNAALKVMAASLLADEPTSDLDEQTEQEIMDLLLEIHAAGTTVLMVTHSLELTNYATRVVRMENGVMERITNG